MTGFYGEPTQAVENDFLRLEYLARSARIVRLLPKGRANLFAELNDKAEETPYGNFYFRGGHRLWHAPESFPRTYMPEHDAASVENFQNGVRIEMPAERWTNIIKRIEIRLDAQLPRVVVLHSLQNDGAWTIELAPWALTMFRLGGVAIFPQNQESVDSANLLPNRHLSLWQYARINDPRLKLRDDFILVHAFPNLPPLKFGYFTPHGWMAYWLDNVLFVKHFDSPSGAGYPDGGCNAESYCNDQFIELESLGALRKLEPGETIFHVETWEIYDSLDVPFLSAEIKAAILAAGS